MTADFAIVIFNRMQAFAQFLRREMKAHEHCQADLADLSTLSQPAISAYLKSKRTPDLRAFALLVGVYPRLIVWLTDLSKSLKK